MTRHDLGTFRGSAASRLIASHHATAQFTAVAFIALCIVIFTLVIAAAAKVGPAVV